MHSYTHPSRRLAFDVGVTGQRAGWGDEVAWDPKLKTTPRLIGMLNAEEQRATARGDGYLGTEHLLEAIIEEPDGVARSILDRLGVLDDIRRALDRLWSSPVVGSLLMVEPGLPRDEHGDPYRVLTVADRPGAPRRLMLDDDGQPLVRTPRTREKATDPVQRRHQPAPPPIADAARRWQAEQ